MFWEAELENLGAESLRRLQVQRLQATVRAAGRAPFYQKVFRERGLTPESFQSIEDLAQIPFTTKEDMRSHYPYGFLTVPKQELIRLHCSSGTTGNPTVIFHNRHDLDSWANLVARSMFAAGVRDTDVFQNICGYGLFTGGLGFQYGAERLGALTIPAGAGNSRRQIKLMQDFGTSVIHAIPSYLPRLHEMFQEMGLHPASDTRLRIILTGAEPHSEETRLRLQDLFQVKVFNSYGLSEMNGPGVAFECEEQAGLHLWEDCFLMELINPLTLEPAAPGEIGELVLTTLDRQAMPIIRYRTRDLTQLLPGTCPCGRVHRRIDRITGRSDDMFIIKGCNVFPIQIERVLMRVPQVGTDYLISLDDRNGSDELILQVEVRPEWFNGDLAFLEKLRSKITHEIHDEILVTPQVQLVEPGTLPRSEGKAVRVSDKRQGRGG